MSTSPMNKETEITDNGLPKVLSQIITDNVYFLKQRHRVPQTSIANAMQDRKSTRLNSSHLKLSRMPSSA